MNRVQLPIDDLKNSGVALQQAIVLTRMRVNGLKSSRLKARGSRIVQHADELFMRVSEAAQVSARLSGFMQKAFGVTIDDLFGLAPDERLARGAAYTGMAALDRVVRKTIDELNSLNREIDEVKHG